MTDLAGSRFASPTPRRILAFWVPLAATWLMMAIEGPYVAAIIARLADPTLNLAAYGVAFSFAFIAEAPIIMVMTASNALVRDRASYLRLRRFVYTLNALLTAAVLVGVFPPLFRFVSERLIGLPADVARLTHVATALLVFWPAAIGYRRFHQGILVRHHMPRRVAYGTIVRLVSMSVTAMVLAWAAPIPGACLGSLALMSGVLCEAAASRWMARHVVAGLLRAPAGQTGSAPFPRVEGEGATNGDAPSADLVEGAVPVETSVAPPATASRPALTTRDILAFYYPLALTSLLAIAINPLVTFFLGRSRSALDSLAVLPVITGLVFVFRSGAIAYQEVAVALLGPAREHARPIAGVGRWLAGAAALCLATILFTPLAGGYFTRVAGLSPELSHLAVWPARALAFVPVLDYLLTFQRARLILARQTRFITIAAAIESATIIAGLVVAIGLLDVVGALGATCALFAGRLAGNLFLLTPRAAAAAAPPPV